MSFRPSSSRYVRTGNISEPIISSARQMARSQVPPKIRARRPANSSCISQCPCCYFLSVSCDAAFQPPLPARDAERAFPGGEEFPEREIFHPQAFARDAALPQGLQEGVHHQAPRDHGALREMRLVDRVVRAEKECALDGLSY